MSILDVDRVNVVRHRLGDTPVVLFTLIKHLLSPPSFTYVTEDQNDTNRVPFFISELETYASARRFVEYFWAGTG
jgi:hypothetical protein